MTVASPTARRTRLRSSRSLLLLDGLRTPYQVEPGLRAAGVERLVAGEDGAAAIHWPADLEAVPEVAARLDGADGDAIPMFARVLPDQETLPLVGGGEDWTRVRDVRGPDGGRLASVWQSSRGDVLLPFDPDEVVTNFLSERYAGIGAAGAARGSKRWLMRAYYRVRPLLPRAVQIALRRAFARLQARTPFPRWPVETALHDFQDAFVGCLATLAGEPIPALAAWPAPFTWALVLTHDVELTRGYENMDPVLDLERAHGFRSAWNFVPLRYPIDDARLRELAAMGWEVGVHGLHHDGRDLESLEILQQRLPGIREAAERWGAVGFRSPATHRHWDWMPLLGFDYDASSPDTDPFEPQAGGCCSWLPFFNRDLVELPLTMPQDHTLFVILRRRDESDWVAKAGFLRSRGGMALMDTHPDYLVDEQILRAYGRVLEHFAGDATAWKAVPREVSSWWRRRAASGLVADGDGWRVVGPAAGEARMELLEGRW